jgi:large subunit ribosomal protein L32
MAVQKRRQSSARRDSRRAQWMASVKVPNITRCPDCGEAKASHRVCMKCGSYNGEKVVVVTKSEEQA